MVHRRKGVCNQHLCRSEIISSEQGLNALILFGLFCDCITYVYIYDGVEAKTRKSQASFQIIQVSSEALPRMRLE